MMDETISEEKPKRNRLTFGEKGYLVFDGYDLEGLAPFDGGHMSWLSYFKIPRVKIMDVRIVSGLTAGYIAAHQCFRMLCAICFGVFIAAWLHFGFVGTLILICAGVLLTFRWNQRIDVEYEGGILHIALPRKIRFDGDAKSLVAFIENINGSKCHDGPCGPVVISRSKAHIVRWLIENLFLPLGIVWYVWPLYEPNIEVSWRRSMIDGGVISVKNVSTSQSRGVVSVGNNKNSFDLAPGDSKEFGCLQLGQTIKDGEIGSITLDGFNLFGRQTFYFKFMGQSESMSCSLSWLKMGLE